MQFSGDPDRNYPLCRGKIKVAVAVLAIVLAVMLTVSDKMAQAQTNYPGEHSGIVFNVSAKAYIVSASNCYPYARGCLGIYDPPVTVAYLVEQAYTNNVELLRGYASYFPFTPCLLRLPLPTRGVRATDLGMPLTDIESSALHGRPAKIASISAGPLQHSGMCHLSPVDWRFIEEQAIVQPVPYPDQLQFHIRLTKVSEFPPGKPTAPYGYSGYFGGKRFHEGFDTSWTSEDPTANIIWSPFPISPFLSRGGWAMGIAPCALLPAMMRMDNEGFVSYKVAMENLLNGTTEDPFLDCAFLFGGFHVVSEFPKSPPYEASVAMNLPENRGKTPWEIGLIYPRGSTFAVCATVSGYAGDFTPHCHYQASIIPGDIIRQWVNEMREHPSVFFRPVPELIVYRNRDWGGFWEPIYRYSIDPALLLLPEVTCNQMGSLAMGWRTHAWPEDWGRYITNLFSPTAWWYQPGKGEYIIGIHSPEGAIEQLAGKECQIVSKEIPGCYCEPPSPRNYYNSDGEHSRQKVRATENHILRPMQAYLKAAINCDSPSFGTSPYR